MADWCDAVVAISGNKRRKSILEYTGFWCKVSFDGHVTVDYGGVSAESGSGIGTVIGSSGSFVFTPPAGLPSVNFRLFGGAGGGGGGMYGEEGWGRDGEGADGGFRGGDTGTQVLIPANGVYFTGLETFDITVGRGGAGDITDDSSGPGDNGTESTFDSGIWVAAGGIGGAANHGVGDDACNAETQGLPGEDSAIGTGGAGGGCDGDSQSGYPGDGGGPSAGGGGGGGGGGGLYLGDIGADGGDGGRGGDGRLQLDWSVTQQGPGTQDAWC